MKCITWWPPPSLRPCLWGSVAPCLPVPSSPGWCWTECCQWSPSTCHRYIWWRYIVHFSKTCQRSMILNLTNLMLASLSCSARRMLLSENVCQSPGKLSATLYRALPDLRWMLPRVFFRLTLRESEQLNSIIYSLYNLQLQ